MKSVNKVILIGNLGLDPQLTTFDSGSKVVRASLATNREYTKKDAQGVETPVKEVEWHNLEAWNGLAGVMAQYLKKGDPIYIEGRIKTDKYEDNGQEKFFTKVIVDNMVMLGGGNGTPAPTEEDIPF